MLINSLMTRYLFKHKELQYINNLLVKTQIYYLGNRFYVYKSDTFSPIFKAYNSKVHIEENTVY